ncbi:MAG: VOC family protein [Pseudomonadota bacterium]
MPGAIPYFSYADGKAAMAFLEAAFGFESLAAYADDKGGLMHGEMKRGDVAIMLGARPADAPGPAAPAPLGTYLVVDDVDAVFVRAINAGGTEIWAPHDTEFGTRRARLADPEGFEWSLGTYVPDAAS